MVLFRRTIFFAILGLCGLFNRIINTIWVADALIDLNSLQIKLSDDIRTGRFSLPGPLDYGALSWHTWLKYSVDGYFKNYSNGEPIVFYPMAFHPDGFGNLLGNYLEALSCAVGSGFRFVGFDVPIPKGEEWHEKLITAMVNSLRKVDSSQKPIAHFTSKSMDDCAPINFPWTYAKAAQYNNWNNVRMILPQFVDQMKQKLKGLDPHFDEIADFATVINKSKNISLLPPFVNASTEPLIRSMHLPFSPDVAILFRCSDVLGHDEHSPYGFVNFHVYYTLIPQSAKTIYILSESLWYTRTSSEIGKLTPTARTCIQLTTFLAHSLARRFPNATVAVRRGHAEAGFLQLATARLTISPPSTFGFYAMASQGEYDVSSYFPETTLIGGGDEFFIHRNFHWVSIPRLVHLGDYLNAHRNDADQGYNITAFIEMLTTW